MKKIRFKKQYYKIGEAAQLLSVRPSVLRFWETEFNIATPKMPSGQRIYSVQGLQLLFKIKYLLYEEKYTIEGAKKKLKNRQLKLPMDQMLIEDTLHHVKKELKKLLDSYEQD